MARYLVTGGAGFIGSHLVDRLLSDGHDVTAYDNLSTGRMEFLSQAQANLKFRFVRGDLLDFPCLAAAIEKQDVVCHLAANADIRCGIEHPRKDLEQNTIATYNVLEAMRLGGVRRIAFSSTSAIYGEPEVFPTPETCPLPIQTSLYGASKMASEGLISAYCHGYGFQACIFRFVSILGERYTHGHVFDFYRKLRANPRAITILGNGQQRKSYLYVNDCVNAVLLAMNHATQPVQVFNLGSETFCRVDDSLALICEQLKLAPERIYTGGERGWVGDSPFIFLDTSKIKSLGWRPQLSIPQSISRTLTFLQENPWVLERSDGHQTLSGTKAA